MTGMGYGVTLQELRSRFEDCGQVTKVLITTDYTVGLVRFSDPASIITAIVEKNGTQLGGGSILVSKLGLTF